MFRSREQKQEKQNENLLKGIGRGDIHLVLKALRKGANVNAADSSGESALGKAARIGYLDIVKILLGGRTVNIMGTGRTINIEARDGLVRNDKTPLHIAVFHGHVKIVETLLEHGANVNARDFYGNTPLLWAALKGNTEIARILLNYRADVNLRSQSGCSALTWAQNHATHDVARLILNHPSLATSRAQTSTPSLVNPRIAPPASPVPSFSSLSIAPPPNPAPFVSNPIIAPPAFPISSFSNPVSSRRESSAYPRNSIFSSTTTNRSSSLIQANHPQSLATVVKNLNNLRFKTNRGHFIQLDIQDEVLRPYGARFGQKINTPVGPALVCGVGMDTHGLDEDVSFWFLPLSSGIYSGLMCWGPFCGLISNVSGFSVSNEIESSDEAVGKLFSISNYASTASSPQATSTNISSTTNTTLASTQTNHITAHPALSVASTSQSTVKTFQERLKDSEYEGEIPLNLLCPISLEIMNKPITTSTGYTFDLASLEGLFASKEGYPETVECPITKLPIHRRELKFLPSNTIKGMIEEFVKAKEDAKKLRQQQPLNSAQYSESRLFSQGQRSTSYTNDASPTSLSTFKKY